MVFTNEHHFFPDLYQQLPGSVLRDMKPSAMPGNAHYQTECFYKPFIPFSLITINLRQNC
jgi:hypothetical protein